MSGLRLCRAGPGPWTMRPGKSLLALKGSPTWGVRMKRVSDEVDLELEGRNAVSGNASAGVAPPARVSRSEDRKTESNYLVAQLVPRVKIFSDFLSQTFLPKHLSGHSRSPTSSITQAA